MRRRRMLDPAIAYSSQVSRLSFSSRWLYILAILGADDLGRMKEHSLYAIWLGSVGSIPGRKNRSLYRSALRDLESERLLHVYRSPPDAGETFVCHPNWTRFQKLRTPAPSPIPPCPTCLLEASRDLAERLGSDPEETPRRSRGRPENAPILGISSTESSIGSPEDRNGPPSSRKELRGLRSHEEKRIEEKGREERSTNEEEDDPRVGRAAVVYCRLLERGVRVRADGTLSVEESRRIPDDLREEVELVAPQLARLAKESE